MTLDLGCVVRNVRSELERAIEGARNGPTKEADDLEAMYGPKPFKCSRLSCRYFYDGFATAQQREKHYGKHLLPSRCTVIGYSRSSLGMASERKLEKHARETHGSGRRRLSESGRAQCPGGHSGASERSEAQSRTKGQAASDQRVGM